MKISVFVTNYTFILICLHFLSLEWPVTWLFAYTFIIIIILINVHITTYLPTNSDFFAIFVLFFLTVLVCLTMNDTEWFIFI